MSKRLITQTLLISCLAHTGYRRAGMAFNKGENRFQPDTFNADQLAQLETDPRLNVVAIDDSVAQASEPSLSQGTVAATAVVSGISFADAVTKLNQQSADDFTASGKPQCNALEALMQRPISAGERDALWAAHLANSLAPDAAKSAGAQ